MKPEHPLAVAAQLIAAYLAEQDLDYVSVASDSSIDSIVVTQEKSKHRIRSAVTNEEINQGWYVTDAVRNYAASDLEKLNNALAATVVTEL